VKVPPDQRLAIRSVVKSEGQPSNGSPKPDGIKGVGSVLSPEKCIVVVRKDNPEIQDKADVLDLTEGSSPLHEMASAGVTTGVLDQGMCSCKAWVSDSPTQLTENRKNRLAKLFRILTCQMCRPDTHALTQIKYAD